MDVSVILTISGLCRSYPDYRFLIEQKIRYNFTDKAADSGIVVWMKKGYLRILKLKQFHLLVSKSKDADEISFSVILDGTEVTALYGGNQDLYGNITIHLSLPNDPNYLHCHLQIKKKSWNTQWDCLLTLLNNTHSTTSTDTRAHDEEEKEKEKLKEKEIETRARSKSSIQKTNHASSFSPRASAQHGHRSLLLSKDEIPPLLHNHSSPANSPSTGRAVTVFNLTVPPNSHRTPFDSPVVLKRAVSGGTGGNSNTDNNQVDLQDIYKLLVVVHEEVLEMKNDIRQMKSDISSLKNSNNKV